MGLLSHQDISPLLIHLESRIDLPYKDKRGQEADGARHDGKDVGGHKHPTEVQEPRPERAYLEEVKSRGDRIGFQHVFAGSWKQLAQQQQTCCQQKQVSLDSKNSLLQIGDQYFGTKIQ